MQITSLQKRAFFSNQTEYSLESSTQLNLPSLEQTLFSLRDHDLNLLHQFQSVQLMELIEEVKTKDVDCGDNINIQTYSEVSSQRISHLQKCKPEVPSVAGSYEG